LKVSWSAIISSPVALEVALAESISASRSTGGHNHRAIPFERFSSRPVSEVVLMDVWPLLRQDILTEAVASRIAVNLTGGPVRYRTAQISSAPDRLGRRTIYAPPHIAAGWIDRINAAEAANVNAGHFILACHAYAEVALSHPFADGNGRVARAMFQRAFARAGLLDAPLIPLGPLIYLNHKVVIAALVRLGTTGEWPPFLDVMARLTLKALAFTEHHLKSQLRPPRDIDSP
jgi:hypothetical protein